MIKISTPLTDIYKLFLSKINSYSLNSLDDEDLEEILEMYLKSAIPKFKFCVQSLNYSYNETSDKYEFECTLTNEEKLILSLFMVQEWYNPILNKESLLKEKFGNKDYQLFSSANLIKELKDIKKEIKKEIDELVMLYYYTND